MRTHQTIVKKFASQIAALIHDVGGKIRASSIEAKALRKLVVA